MGRLHMRAWGPAFVVAWSEMAGQAPSLAGYPGEVILVAAEVGRIIRDAPA